MRRVKIVKGRQKFESRCTFSLSYILRVFGGVHLTIIARTFTCIQSQINWSCALAILPHLDVTCAVNTYLLFLHFSTVALLLTKVYKNGKQTKTIFLSSFLLNQQLVFWVLHPIILTSEPL